MREGKAESVAVVRCWFGVRRHPFKAVRRVSGSAICSYMYANSG